ncbi:MAG: oxygenase MpaB family protein [Aeromicrobium erythreum]
MTTPVTASAPGEAFATRFRAGEERGARIGRVLRLLGRVREVDEDLMRELGQGFDRVDEPAAALVARMRAPGGPALRDVTAAVRAAVSGRQPRADAPQELRRFVEVVTAEPDWLDREQVEAGAAVYRRLGRTAGDVLLQLSLIGGYRFGGPTDLLVATGGLTGDTTRRRVAETQHWTVLVTEPGALLPGGPGWSATVHVRLMHAFVNHRFSHDDRWDQAHWGRPINQTDQAATLGLFSGALLVGARALGVPISRHESDAVMHLWRYVGWLLGVDEAWLFATEREQHRFSYHVLRAQDDVTPAGGELARSIVATQSTLHFRRFAAWQRVYAPRRLLSMLRMFLGRQSLRELGLPVRLPWASVAAIAANTWRHRVLARTPWGRRRLQAWSRRYRDEQLRRYFGDDVPDVGAIS